MAIAPIAFGDRQSRAKINAAIQKANEVDGKASIAQLSAEAAARRDAILAEAKARDAAINALPLPMPVQHRPGDAPVDFGRSLADGEAGGIEPVPPAILRYDENGRVVRLTGDDIVAPRHLYAVEPGRRYLATYVVQRRVNSPDPDNDGIRVALAWYGQGKGRLVGTAQTVVADLLGLTTGSGRQVVRAVVARAAGTGIDIVAPAGTRYARPYVQSYGTLVQNDVEVIGWIDITDVVAFAPDVSAIEARVGALESLDLGDRLTEVAAQVTAPNELRFSTVGDASAAMVPVSADTVQVLGYAEPGDGGGGRYRRAPVEPSHAAKFQSADGAWWEFADPELRLEHLGGIGDDVFDNAAVFKNAVLAASALRIKLRPAAHKTYRIEVDDGDAISFSGLPYVDIQGFGSSSVLKFVGEIDAHAFPLTECPGASVTDVHIDMIDCIQPAGSNKSSLIFIACSGAVAARNTISGFHWIGLGFESCDNLLGELNHISRRDDLTGSDLKALSHGINCSSSISACTGAIRNNTIDDCGTIFVGHDMEISGNVISRSNYGAGIATGGAVGAITGFGYRVLNNVCRYGYGIDVDGTYVGGMEIIGDRSLIKGNLCYGNYGCGIDNFSANSVIIGNECFNNGVGGGPRSRSGINMNFAFSAGYAANDCLVSGNRCYDTGGGTQEYGYSEYDGTTGALSGINLVGNAFKGNAIGETLVQSPLGSYYGSRLYKKIAYASPTIPAGALDYGCLLTFAGAALGDFVEVTLSVGATGVHAYGHVSAVNAVQVVLHNTTLAPVSLGTIDVRITVERPPT